MMNEETRRKLREMGMEPFVDALDQQDDHPDTYAVMTFDERLSMAVDECYTIRNADRAKRLIRYAKLRYPEADINTMYYKDRGFDRNQILELGSCQYIRTQTNIFLNGFTGSGKTHLACALGKEACRHLYRTKYIRMPEMLEMLNLAEQTGTSISTAVKRLSNYQLLIIDEWLMEVPSEREVSYIIEIFEKRHDKWPTILCSQYKTSEWRARLGGGTIAEGIVDRVIHNKVEIEMGDINMRAKLAPQYQL